MDNDKLESETTAHADRAAIAETSHLERVEISDKSDVESQRATSSDLQMAKDIGMLTEAVANIDKTLVKVDTTLSLLLAQQTETALLKQWKERFEPEHQMLMKEHEDRFAETNQKSGITSFQLRIWKVVAFSATVLLAIHDHLITWILHGVQWILGKR